MIRWLLAGLVAILLGSVLAVAVLKDSGYILIGYDVWTIEGSLALFILLDVILFVALYFTIRFLLRLWNTPHDIKAWHHHRQLRLAQKALTRGLLEMAEGDWKGAEKTPGPLCRQCRDTVAELPGCCTRCPVAGCA